MTWWNCVRTSPRAAIRAGQWTTMPLRVPPQCEATCLVHWYGVSIAWAQPTAKWLYAPGVPKSSMCDAMNSGVSRAAAPLNRNISLKEPLSVPSPDAPLSPMM